MLEVKKQVTDGLPTTDAMAAFSNKTQDLMDALSILYIRYNASGRNIFREKWSDVAGHIFGEELTKYDIEGVNDFERRKELELEAGERRIALKTTIKEIVEKSVDKGMLQFDYVGQIIDEYGASISQYLYEGNIIERVRPGIMAKYKSELDAMESKEQEDIAAFDKKILEKSSACENIIEAPVEQKLSVEEKSILSNTSDSVRVMETQSSAEEYPDEVTKLDEYINTTEKLKVPENTIPIETPQAEETVTSEVAAAPETSQMEKKESTPITFSDLSESVGKVSVLLEEPNSTDINSISGEQ